MSANSPSQINRSLIRQPTEATLFNHPLPYPIGFNLCTSAESIRSCSNLPEGVALRIVIRESHNNAIIFIQEKDWQKIQATKHKKRVTARWERARAQLFYSPLVLIGIIAVACIVGGIWTGIIAIVGKIFSSTPNLWLSFIWPAEIAGIIALIGCIKISLSEIFKEDQ